MPNEPKWTARERELVSNCIYSAKRALPTGGDKWADHVDANAKAFVTADLEGFAAMREECVARAAERLPEMRVELEALLAKLGPCCRTSTEADRVARHEKDAARDAAKARGFRRLLAKIEAHGLPPADKV